MLHASATDCRAPKTCASHLSLLFQRARKKVYGSLPCVSGIIGTVRLLVRGIFELMAGFGINLDVVLLAHLIERLFKLLYVVGRDSLILAAEVYENRSEDSC